ncbi:MAG TPA: hypothetical protein VMV39_08295 [Terracidiphilus sp.]|nr:hypothetical protein [Terracidiphilus sp.]
MKGFRILAVAALASLGFAGAAQKSAAQISINIGVAPVCPYGYFDYAPYSCAPIGYYGPQWFTGGVFIGAGPWFHGPGGFRGYVDHDYDPRFGYRGYLPPRGERADWGRHRGWDKHFRGNEMREEHWHDNGHHYGQYKDHGNGHGNGHGGEHGNGHGHGRDK